MTDIFIAYARKDQERVRLIHDALEAQGFKVFWDRETPPGVKWDAWIRQRLTESKCAVVFWSAASSISDNVPQEAEIAKRQGKLIPVLLEPLTADQFPMGHYSTQAVNLSDWNGDLEHEGWRQLSREIKTKLMPGWMQQEFDELKAELEYERARREEVERRDKVLRAQIDKGARAFEELKRERNDAVEEAEALRTRIEELSRAEAESKAQAADSSQRLRKAETQLQAALGEAVALNGRIEALNRANSEREARASHLSQRLDEAATKLAASKAGESPRTLSSRARGVQLVSIVAALATVGFWIYQLRLEDEPASELKATVEKLSREKAAGERQIAELSGLERQLKSEQNITKALTAALDLANTKETQLQKELDAFKPKGKQPEAAPDVARAPQRRESAPATTTDFFSIRADKEILGTMLEYFFSLKARSECENLCYKNKNCTAFSYYRINGACYLYSKMNRLIDNKNYDSGEIIVR